jgi:hypothetical protein
MSKKRIRWTDEEKGMIAENVAKDYKMTRGTCFSWLQSLKRAQKCLPEDRRRKIVAISAVPWLEEMVLKIVNEEKQTQEPKIIEKSIRDFSTEELITELVDRLILKKLAKQNEIVVNQVIGVLGKSINESIKPPKAKQKDLVSAATTKVSIFGLLPKQENEIKKEMDGVMDIYFSKPSSTPSSSQISDKVNNSKAVILMTKFISHGLQDAVKKIDASKVRYCNGGLSQLKDMLYDLI